MSGLLRLLTRLFGIAVLSLRSSNRPKAPKIGGFGLFLRSTGRRSRCLGEGFRGFSEGPGLVFWPQFGPIRPKSSDSGSIEAS